MGKKLSSNLNRTRKRDSLLGAIVAVGAVLVSRGWLVPGSLAFEACIYAGYACIALCVLGRVYSTAFIGGLKNKVLITQGPFSVTRNPLYLFSFIGIFGIGLASGRISIALFLLLLHLVTYHFLIRREEAWLTQSFGAEYESYRARVPRLWPDLAQFSLPEQIALRPRLLLYAVRDGSVWFLAFPFFRLVDHLHAAGALPARLLLP